MRRYLTVVFALMLALVPSTLSAQAQVAVSGFGGAFLPASDLLTGVFPLEEFGGTEVAATFRQKVAFNFGGRITVWPTQRFGIEAEAAYVLSDLEADVLEPVVRDPGPPQVLGLNEGSAKFDANAFMGSLNVVFALIRPPLEPLVVYVSAGLGFVSRGGDGFDPFEGTSDVAGTWGFGLKYGVARGLWLRGDVRDYISSFQEEPLDSKVQNDLLITAGFEYAFGV